MKTASLLLCVLIGTVVTARGAQPFPTDSDKIVSEFRNVEAFTGIRVKGSSNVYLTQGATQSVRVEADGNIIEYVRTEVSGGVLNISMDKNIRMEADGNIIKSIGRLLGIGTDGDCGRTSVRVYVTMPDVRKLTVSGSGAIIAQTPINTPELACLIQGSGDIIAQTPINASELACSIQGSGDIKLSGKAKTHEISIRGSGDVEAYDLESENATVKVSGSGDCAIHVTKRLKIDVAGSGDVRYKGNPSLDQIIRGSGSVSHR